VLSLIAIFDPNAQTEDFFSWRFFEQVTANLAPGVEPALAAFAAAVVLTPMAIWAARRTGFLAHPLRDRDIHRRPIPYGGGLAMYGAFAAACLLFLRDQPVVPGLLIVGGLTTAVFVVDDRWGIPALVKLAMQIGIAAAAVLLFGFKIQYLFLPLLHVPSLSPMLVLPITVLWIVGMQNTTNLLDGVDGLAAGVVAITAIVLLVASAGRQPEAVGLAAALVGACLGFLLFNFHPARIFMGDSGAYFLGLAIALLSVVGVAKVAVVAAIAVPVLAMGIPIADAALSIIRRRRNGAAITHADARHIHHRLLEAGLTQRQTCILFYGASGILGAIGLTVFGHRRVLAVVIVLMVVVLSTAVGERLRASSRRVPAPLGRVMRQLLLGRAAR
jgi:UDP-GlcNAc:undecaprenyl-phosphate GlcNAc-1-phosphate transferase